MKLYYSNGFYSKKLLSIGLHNFVDLCLPASSKDKLKRAYFSTVFIDSDGLAIGDNTTEETTGYLAVDIDNIDNPMEAVNELFKLPYCVHAQRSFSGNGVWGIIHHNVKALILLPLIIDIIEQEIPFILDPNCVYRASGRSLNYDAEAKHRGFNVEPLQVPAKLILQAITIKSNSDSRAFLKSSKPSAHKTFENCVDNTASNYSKAKYISKVIETIRSSSNDGRWQNSWKAISSAKKALGDISMFSQEIYNALEVTGLTTYEIKRLMNMLG